MENPLVNGNYVLEKYPGKGGWTFAVIPEVSQDKKAPFGWVKVRGSVDGYAFRKHHLMPMGNGKLFLSVKAEIRKAIRKQAGDTVHVILYADNEALEVPTLFLECVSEEPRALTFFNTLSESEQKMYIDWIYSAKTAETQERRLGQCIDRLLQGKKRYDQ